MLQEVIDSTWPELYRNYKITNTVAYNFLINHEKHGVRKLAIELQKRVANIGLHSIHAYSY